MENNAKKGLLVLGHPRSGTTLYRRLLNSHKNIACPPETHIFNSIGRLLEADITAEGVDIGILAGLEFAGFTEDKTLKSLREFSFDFLEQYALKQNKSRWAEKTAFNIYYLNEIVKLCEEHVYYLGIIRHPFDVAKSSLEFCNVAGVYFNPMHEYIKKYPQPIEAFVHSWIDTTNNLLDLGARYPENTIIIRYEDLVTNPEDTMKDVLNFINEPFNDGFLKKELNIDDAFGFNDEKGLSETKIHQKSVETWHSLPAPQIARLGNLVNPLLEKCGYNPITDTSIISTKDARKRFAKSTIINAIDREQEIE